MTKFDPVTTYERAILASDLARGLGSHLQNDSRDSLIEALINAVRSTLPGNNYPDDQPYSFHSPSWSARQRLDAWLRIAELEQQTTEQDRWTPPDLYSLIPVPSADQHTNRSAQLLCAKYPVTNFQYRRFVDDKANYHDEALWTSLVIHDRAQSESIPVGEAAHRWFLRKDHARFPLFGENGQGLEVKNRFNPVAVNWYEAAAFCAWLNRNFESEYRRSLPDEPKNFVFRLALEYEWVAAAGGEANGRYVWQEQAGDDVSADTIGFYANTIESRLGQLTPVFMFPAGASPYGVMDLSGNGREWIGNYFDKYQNVARCRGSNLNDSYRGATAAECVGFPLDNRGVGFRVVCVSHST